MNKDTEKNIIQSLVKWLFPKPKITKLGAKLTPRKKPTKTMKLKDGREVIRRTPPPDDMV